MSDCHSEWIALRESAMIRLQAPFNKGSGAANPQVPGRKPAGAEGTFSHMSCFAGSVQPQQFPCCIGFISLWARKEHPCTPGDKSSWTKYFFRPWNLSAEEQR